jgi:hypothetical protein
MALYKKSLIAVMAQRLCWCWLRPLLLRVTMREGGHGRHIIWTCGGRKKRRLRQMDGLISACALPLCVCVRSDCDGDFHSLFDARRIKRSCGEGNYPTISSSPEQQLIESTLSITLGCPMSGCVFNSFLFFLSFLTA